MRRSFVDFNGVRFAGEGYIGVVRAMRRSAWLAVPKGDYMRDVATRVAGITQGRTQLDVTGPKAFVLSLVEAKFLTETTRGRPA